MGAWLYRTSILIIYQLLGRPSASIRQPVETHPEHRAIRSVISNRMGHHTACPDHSNRNDNRHVDLPLPLLWGKGRVHETAQSPSIQRHHIENIGSFYHRPL